jgi:UDP-glucose-4-epimerase GalE
LSNQPHVLVTGGAGYIGSHACKTLAGAGFVPVTIDNFVYGHRWAVKYGPLVEADLADKNRLRGVFSDYPIEAVVHFAAYTYVGESVENPRKYFQNNVTNSLNLLEAMIDANVMPFVYSSTCATYGDPETIPLVEDHSQNPVNPYGESKRFIERAARWFGEAYGIRWAALRYFNAAGADPEGEIGESHDPETHLIPVVIEAALENRPHVAIFGTDYSTRDGTAVRDYVHVADLASAHLSALKHLMDGGASGAFNLGTGRGHSVREVIASVERISGLKVPVRDKGRRPGDAPELIADPSRAAEILGWRPHFQDLDRIVETAWRWHSREEK